MFQTFCTDILEPSIASTAVSQRSEDRSGEFDLLPVFLGRRLRTRNSNFPAGFPRFLACLLSLRPPKYEVKISSMIFGLSPMSAGVCGCSDICHRLLRPHLRTSGTHMDVQMCGRRMGAVTIGECVERDCAWTICEMSRHEAPSPGKGRIGILDFPDRSAVCHNTLRITLMQLHDVMAELEVPS